MGKIPWKLNSQWADLVTRSGTSLFVSAKPGVLNETEKEELHQMMLKASLQEEHKIPLDWDYTVCPFLLADENVEVEYIWFEEAGPETRGNSCHYYRYIPLS